MQEDDSVVTRDEFIIGTLVDMKITEPEEIKNKFMLIDKVPTKSYAALADAFLQAVEDRMYNLEDEANYKQAILDAAEAINFQRNWKAETIIKNFIENCEDYIKLVSEAKAAKKTLYTIDHEIEAEQLYQTLITGEYTQSYFMESENIKYFDQVEIYYTFQGIEFKCKLDRVVVDILNKKIIPTDIKTYNGNFMESYYKYMYWLQAILYQVPLHLYRDAAQTTQLFEQDFSFEIDERNKELLEYIGNPEFELELGKFTFLTVDKSGKNPPMPFVSFINPTNTAKAVMLFDPIKGHSLQYAGWASVAKIAWEHIQTNEWVYPLELKQKGYITL